MSQRPGRGWSQPGYPGNVVNPDKIFRRDLRNIELKLADQRAAHAKSSMRSWGPWITFAAILVVIGVFVGGAVVAVVVLGGFIDLETFGRPQSSVDAIVAIRNASAHWKAAGPASLALWNLALHSDRPLVVQGTAQYQAGLPTFPRVFGRDSIMSALLLESPKMTRAILVLCAKTIGSSMNPVTGEEPGKVFHELPGVQLDVREKYRTDYNSLDSTPLFIIASLQHFKLTGDTALLKSHAKALTAAMSYIVRHTNQQGFFEEDPKYCGAKRFALGCTYWKDSPMPNRENGIPAYPVSFTLVQSQALCATRCYQALARVLPDELELSMIPPGLQDKMLDATRQMIRAGNTVAIDRDGVLTGSSTDSLHALWYLRGQDVDQETVRNIMDNLEPLTTDVGYSTASIHQRGTYHNDVVWSFEQAFLHAAATRFGLKAAIKVTERAARQLVALSRHNLFPERVDHDHKGLLRMSGMGPHTQLWTVCAVLYFRQGLKPMFVEDPESTVLGSSAQTGGTRYAAYIGALMKGLSPAFKCFNGEGPANLNDGICECSDGSDEPSTAACKHVANRLFSCFQGKQTVDYSKVGDGICDCCDGSDEYLKLDTHCPHSPC